ncbi:6-pyruvoyl tetrahydropterin synthase [Candidatus Pseudothioglobus singularis]|uniref:6-carboxytetrahydropterin synthase QueD n=1 Tax=Candidatus Pseudothioglobus singularis TaxID=1427364 RepID=UPI0008060B70|nr:6-carboxytetrahydropterin synthase QueD [Candidatus Pseudothioglobus singularis]ANQ66919.1 6-pyruvoyl tetrahydropterin synthase [Candidatus Pseudothioglobus singularis]
MFVLKIVTDFASAHSLRNYPGDCSRLHGHNWQVEVSVCSQVLDDNGIAIDFREIKKQTKLVIKRVDHQYLNEIEPFDVLNPTAENRCPAGASSSKLLVNGRNVKVNSCCRVSQKLSAVTYSE